MRLELIRPKSLPPQDSVSTNFTTSALLQSDGRSFEETASPRLSFTHFTWECLLSWTPNRRGLGQFQTPPQQAPKQAAILPHPASHCQSFSACLTQYMQAKGWSQKRRLPERPWSGSESWPSRWRQKDCPRHRCQKQHPYQPPCHAEPARDQSPQALPGYEPPKPQRTDNSCRLFIDPPHGKSPENLPPPKTRRQSGRRRYQASQTTQPHFAA